MAILTIPTSTTLANYRFSIELDEVVFELVFSFNPRDDHWYFDLYDETGTLLRAGLKAVTGTPLLRLIKSIDRPDGEILAVDPTGDDLEAGLTDLGDAVTLTYVEEVSLG
jgi:hypothetical protein